jgi:hypothetical protein
VPGTAVTHTGDLKELNNKINFYEFLYELETHSPLTIEVEPRWTHWHRPPRQNSGSRHLDELQNWFENFFMNFGGFSVNHSCPTLAGNRTHRAAPDFSVLTIW